MHSIIILGGENDFSQTKQKIKSKLLTFILSLVDCELYGGRNYRISPFHNSLYLIIFLYTKLILLWYYSKSNQSLLGFVDCELYGGREHRICSFHNSQHSIVLAQKWVFQIFSNKKKKYNLRRLYCLSLIASDMEGEITKPVYFTIDHIQSFWYKNEFFKFFQTIEKLNQSLWC